MKMVDLFFFIDVPHTLRKCKIDELHVPIRSRFQRGKKFVDTRYRGHLNGRIRSSELSEICNCIYVDKSRKRGVKYSTYDSTRCSLYGQVKNDDR